MARRARHANTSGTAGTSPSPTARTLPRTLFTTAVVIALFFGWRQRDGYYLSPETGAGYWLGIVGACLMLSLLLYPLRKRVRWMRSWGSTRHWFQMHMVLGVVGPVIIMFHSNFALGSTNSTLALFAMLSVALSGLVGRYLYSRIHHGLYGRRARLAELDFASVAAREPLVYLFDHVPQLRERLEQLERALEAPAQGVRASISRAVATGLETRAARRACLPLLQLAHSREAEKRGWDRRQRRDAWRAACANLARYLDAVRRVAQYECFVRLFGLWHVLHLPLFILLVVTALVHVLAVHMY